jgi:Beta-lactamase
LEIRCISNTKLRDPGLDQDVNLQLKSWKVPESEYILEQKVTLRRILTHTAGATVHGFLGYEPGQPVPTLVQILNGEKPANNRPVRINFVPGTKERYSGGGVMIEQQLMMDVTGKSFPKIMQEEVFDRLGLKDSTYEPSISASRAGLEATGHNSDGGVLPGKWNFQPELAVGGLWTTPSDLAKIGIELALSKQGKSNRVLSPAMTREMLKLQIDPKIEALEGPRMLMGLGWVLGDQSDPGRFGHTGTNVGYLAEIIMWDDGHGIVVMTNNWSFNAQCVYRYLINNIAKEYGWNYQYDPYTPWPYADTVLLATAKLRGTQAAITKYYELKKLSAGQKGKGAPAVVWASNPPDYPPNEWDLLGLGETLAAPHHLQDAIEIMKIEVSEYPNFPNGAASLAELYSRAGEKKLAVQTYEKLLQLTPGDPAVTEAIKKLKEKK